MLCILVIQDTDAVSLAFAREPVCTDNTSRSTNNCGIRHRSNRGGILFFSARSRSSIVSACATYTWRTSLARVVADAETYRFGFDDRWYLLPRDLLTQNQLLQWRA